MERILSIDPGREKCGMALVEMDGRVIWQRVVPSGEVFARLDEIMKQETVPVVVVGDRTGSRAIRGDWERLGFSGRAKLIPVDEHLSSVEGRRRYLLANRSHGLKRFLPVSLRTPGEPFDDYVAVVLAERYLAGNPRK